jgi:hypothetical protein
MRATIPGLRNERYLGDGVYAGFDGYHVVLYTSDGVQHGKPIYLDHEVRRHLVRYFKQLSLGEQKVEGL